MAEPLTADPSARTGTANQDFVDEANTHTKGNHEDRADEDSSTSELEDGALIEDSPMRTRARRRSWQRIGRRMLSCSAGYGLDYAGDTVVIATALRLGGLRPWQGKETGLQSCRVLPILEAHVFGAIHVARRFGSGTDWIVRNEAWRQFGM